MEQNKTDLICLSHLRWGFVFQRPQHLMSRFARDRRVFFFEEPVFEDLGDTGPYLRCNESAVTVCTPVLPEGMQGEHAVAVQKRLLDGLMRERNISDFVLWYYTPMAREFSRHLSPQVTVYDCMDELSAFAGAPAAMRENEGDLFHHADLVFTGGASLYEVKRNQHASVYLFPSSVDVHHFEKARSLSAEPPDQKDIPRPRLGYAGVIDERMDLELLRDIAQLRPEWHFVLIGPVVKINPETLPRASNLHYLGMKQYAALPTYFAGWEIGMLPFALNASTRFISPTKTPEYLSAGLRVISTPIRDVVCPYGDLNLVGIAESAGDFIRVAENLLSSPKDSGFRTRADAFLSQSSWDRTWLAMSDLIEEKSQLRRISLSADLLENAHV